MRALRAASALEHYERVLAAEPDHYEALWKASDRGNMAAARRAYDTVLRLGISDYNDERYKAQAERALRALP
ncbi:MAG: hypothetical protein H0W42_04875 [Gemmatimonadaceae bacterium]|nr:hypothetical protein [Gemmatimonadaceae bacterium]